VVSIRDVISACEADEVAAQVLGVQPGEVLIQAERLGWARDSRVLEISRAWVKPSHFRFSASAQWED